MSEFNEKPFTVFKGKTAESIKAAYTGEQKEDAEKILALVDLRNNLRHFLVQSGQMSGSEVGQGDNFREHDEEDPMEILQEVQKMLGVVQKTTKENRFDPTPETLAKLDSILEDENIRNEVIRMLLDGKTSRDVRWMIEKKTDRTGASVGRAISHLFAHRNRAIEFIKKHRPETTDSELEKLYARLS